MTFSTLAYIAIVGGVWAFLWWYFARYVIGRRRINSGNRALVWSPGSTCRTWKRKVGTAVAALGGERPP
jgi:hypothetical protein